jgi:hypothetical protein
VELNQGVNTVVTIDRGLMYVAVSDSESAGGPSDTAYLNRRTGEISCLAPTAQEADLWFGEGVGLEMAGKRGSLENRPSDWVEIPKFRSLPAWARQPGDKDDVDEHIRNFLSKNNIVAELR